MTTTIVATVPPVQVVNKNLEFEIRQDGDLIGRLKISRGGLDRYKPSAKRRTGRASWAQFRTWMEHLE